MSHENDHEDHLLDITKQLAVATRQLQESRAQSLTHLGAAHRSLDKASTKHLKASAVVVTMTALGGREICPPFAISDGLSQQTIAALIADITRSTALALAHLPLGLRESVGVPPFNPDKEYHAHP